MAIKFGDPVKQYGGDVSNLIANWNQIYGGLDTNRWSIGVGTGRRGGDEIIVDVGGVSQNQLPASAVISTSSATAIMQFAFRGTTNSIGLGGWGSLNTSGVDGTVTCNPTGAQAGANDGEAINTLCAFRNDGYTQVAISLNPNGTISAWRGDASFTAFSGIDSTATVLGTTANALIFGERYHIAVKVVTLLGTGSVEIRVNDDVWLDLTNVDTVADNGGAAGWDEATLGMLRVNSTPGGLRWRFEDVLVLDGDTSDQDNDLADFPGDCALDYLTPQADDLQGFTPSAGLTHYTMVDERPDDDDTTYNSSSTPGAVDTFQGTGVPFSGASVIGVGVMFMSRRVNAGPSSTRPVIRIGGTTYEIGSAQGDTSSYTYHQGWVNNKPSDHTAWTPAEVDAANPGYKKVT